MPPRTKPFTSTPSAKPLNVRSVALTGNALTGTATTCALANAGAVISPRHDMIVTSALWRNARFIWSPRALVSIIAGIEADASHDLEWAQAQRHVVACS